MPFGGRCVGRRLLLPALITNQYFQANKNDPIIFTMSSARRLGVYPKNQTDDYAGRCRATRRGSQDPHVREKNPMYVQVHPRRLTWMPPSVKMISDENRMQHSNMSYFK
jgi:hypothetical protein